MRPTCDGSFSLPFEWTAVGLARGDSASFSAEAQVVVLHDMQPRVDVAESTGWVAPLFPLIGKIRDGGQDEHQFNLDTPAETRLGAMS